MTISATQVRKTFTGDGSTTAFTYNYRFLANADLKVYLNGTLKTLTTHYTVSGAGDAGGGTVTFLVAPALNDEIVVLNDPSATQTLDLQDNDTFPAESLEAVLDRLTLQIQRCRDLIARGISLADTDISAASTELPTPEANGFWRWNAAGTAVEWVQLDLESAGAAALKTDLANRTDTTKGSRLLGWLSSAAGAGGRWLSEKLADQVSVTDFGVVGDGVADDYAGVQAALTAAAGKELYFPAGTYRLAGGTPIIPSNTRLVLDPQAIIVQPNKGNNSAFAMAPGTIGVTIEGGDIRGPWYGTGPGLWQGVTNSVTVDGDTLADLAENIGICVRGRWYQREILGYNAAQMGALTDTSSRIAIRNVRIDGFGQEAVFADRVTGFEVSGCTLLNCGRGGVRMYGVLRGNIDGNVVGNMSPGWDGDYPNWNVYGITCTRMQGTVSIPDPNLTISRITQDVAVTNNHVYNCHTWKSLDNHGSSDIRFIGNKCLNSYIGLGLDQGGTDANRGIAPAVRNVIMGNVFESKGAQYMRAGMTLYGHNSTDQACESPVVVGNTFIGYGGSDTDGAISLSNVRNAVITGNSIKNASRAAIATVAVVDDCTISGNTIDDPKMYVTVAVSAGGAGYTQAATTCSVSGGGGTGLVVVPIVTAGAVTSFNVVHPGTGYTSAPAITVNGDGAGATGTATLNAAYGVINQAGTASATINNNTFHNRTQATFRAISLATPSAGYGIKVGNENRFISDTGSMTKVYPSLVNEAGGSFGRIPHAMARVTAAGAITSSIGVASVTKTGTGAYDVVLSTAGGSINNMIPDATPYATLNLARASMTGAGTLTVNTASTAGAAADAGFVLTVWNVSP